MKRHRFYGGEHAKRARVNGGITFTQDTKGRLLDLVANDDIEVWIPKGYVVEGGWEIRQFGPEKRHNLTRISVDPTLILRVPVGTFTGPGERKNREDKKS